VAQKAAEAALTGPQDCVVRMREAYRARRDIFVRLMADAGRAFQPPAGAFYAMLPLPDSVGSSTAFAMHLLQQHGIAVAPGDAFGAGGAGHVRLALCVDEATIRSALPVILAAADAWDGHA